ncbi:MAG: hypothetical protein JWQ97_269 [Phenylobacterium sp.]|nr:hypothetical protein [Phenylobacterium sp.]
MPPMRPDQPPAPGSAGGAWWLAEALARHQLALPEACRPGVEANAGLLQSHWQTLRRATIFAAGSDER